MDNSKVPSRIFLIGPMGVGKTTIGIKLAEYLKLDFFDCDREIEQKTGADIPLIFELEGETGFRRRETQTLRSLVERDNLVLATGGGAVISKTNRDMLKQSGFIIYLRAPLDQLLERTAKDRSRPLLQTDNPRNTLAEIIRQREPYYIEIADLIFEAHQKPLRDIVIELAGFLTPHSKKEK